MLYVVIIHKCVKLKCDDIAGAVSELQLIATMTVGDNGGAIRWMLNERGRCTEKSVSDARVQSEINGKLKDKSAAKEQKNKANMCATATAGSGITKIAA